MDYIRKIDNQFTLETGDTVLIRQRNLKAIRQAVLDYMDRDQPRAAKVPVGAKAE